MMRLIRKRLNARNTRAFFTIWVLICCLMCFAFGGLGIDAWKAYAQRQDLSDIADAAAVAGASGIDISDDANDPNSFKNQTIDPTATSTTLPTTYLLPADAQARALAYVNQAIAQDNITLSAPPDIEATPTGITVTLQEKATLTITKAVFEVGSHYYSGFDITVHGFATPKAAH